MKKTGKKLFYTICTGVTVCFVLLLISSLWHTERKINEKETLDCAEIGEYVTIDGKNIHFKLGENQYAEDTVVFMHGLGMGDCIVSTEPMLSLLEKEHQTFVMTRWGNGLSDDCDRKQTVEEIVKEYRSVLCAEEVNAPYILVAHSISGVYATYWAQHYPEEVKAIIYLDSDPAQNYVDNQEEIKKSQGINKLQNWMAQTGIQRFLVSEEDLIGEDEGEQFTQEEEQQRILLMYQNTYSKATCSEMSQIVQNAQQVLEDSVALEIPQLYICTSKISGRYYDECYKSKLEERFKQDQEKILTYKRQQKQILDVKKTEMEKYGNIKIVQLSGPHTIYEYAPEDVAQTILEFLS